MAIWELSGPLRLRLNPVVRLRLLSMALSVVAIASGCKEPSQQARINACFPNYEKQAIRSLSNFENVSVDCLGDSDADDPTFKIPERLRSEVTELSNKKGDVDETKFRKVVDDYQQLQELLSYCRTKQILANPSKGPVFDEATASEIRDTTFLQVQGDIFGAAEEGGKGHGGEAETLAHRKNALTVIRDELKAHVYISDEEQSQPCFGAKIDFLSKDPRPHPDVRQDVLNGLIAAYDNSERLHVLFGQSDSITAFRDELIRQLLALPDGMSLFMPGGWKGHAVNFQFTKQSGDSYGFRVYNEGGGLEYHASSLLGYKQQYFPFVEVTEIPFANVTSFAFLSLIQDIYLKPLSEVDFYERALPMLEGRKDPIEYDPALFADPQNAGTCVYFTAPLVMESVLTKIVAGKGRVAEFIAPELEFLINSKTINDYASTADLEQPGRVNLLRKGLTFFARDAIESQSDFVIDKGAAAAAARIGGRIYDDIAAAQIQLDAVASAGAPQFTSINPGADAPLIFADAQLPALSQIADTTGSIAPSEVSNFSEVDFATFRQDLLDAVERGHYPAAIDAVEKLALQANLHQPQLKQADLAALAQIDELYLWALLKRVTVFENHERITAIQFLTSLTLMTVGDSSNLRTQLDIPSMIQQRIDNFLFGDLSVFQIEDPRWQWKLHELKSYYQNEHERLAPNSKSFFGYEDYPVGLDTAYNYSRGSGASRHLWKTTDVSPLALEQTTSWSKNINWKDLAWAKRWLEKNADFDAVTPPTTTTYECPASDNDNRPLACTVVVQLPPKSRASRENAIQRKAVEAMARNTLPPTFYDLRTLSGITDLLLTAPITPSWTLGSADSHEFVAGRRKSFAFRVSDPSVTTTDETPAFRIREADARRFFRIGRLSGGECSCRYVHPEKASDSELRRLPADEFIEEQFVELSYEIFGAEIPPIDEHFYQKEGEKLKHASQRFYISPYTHLQNATKPFTDDEATKYRQELDKLYTAMVDSKPTRDRQAPNALIVNKLNGLLSDTMSRERARGILGISGIRDQQIIQTLSFFSRHSNLLFLPAYQRLFEKLIFDPTLLLDQLQHNEAAVTILIGELGSFCDRSFDNFYQISNMQGAAFALRMKQIFYDYAVFAKTKLNAKISDADLAKLTGTRAELLRLAKAATDLDEKSFLWLNLVQTYLYDPQPVGSDGIALLLRSYIEHQLHPIRNAAYEDPFGERAVQNILVANTTALLAYFRGNDAALNEIRADILPGTPDGTWIENYPGVFSSGNYTIDVIRGEVVDAGNPIVGFPIPPLVYQKVFGDVKAPENATRLASDQAYSWTWKDGLSARAKLANEAWQIQREEPKGAWFQYLPDDALTVLKDTSAYLPGVDYWQRLGSDDGLTVIESSPFTVTMRGRQVVSIQRKNGDFAINVAKDSPYRVFEQIEDWKSVYLWSTNKKDVVEVELPRLKLKFDVIDGRLRCPLLKDHVVAIEQYSSALGLPVSYLLCEAKTDSSTSRQALVPIQPFVDEPTKVIVPPEDESPAEKSKRLKMERGKKALHSFAAQFQVQHRTAPIEIYDVDDEKLENRVLPRSDTGRFYLALRRLWQHEYRAAAEQIRSNSSVLGPLSESEVTILRWIATRNILDRAYKPSDNDPRADAISLLAASWLIKDAMYYQLAFNDEAALAPLTAMYLAYLQKVDLFNRDLLGVDDEFRIATTLLKYLSEKIEKLNGSAAAQDDSAREAAQDELDRAIRALQRITNRIAAIKLEQANQAYIVNPSVRPASETPAKLARAALRTSWSGGDFEALKLLIDGSNTGQLYQTLLDDDCDIATARSWLLSAVPHADVSNLSMEQFRNEARLWLNAYVREESSQELQSDKAPVRLAFYESMLQLDAERRSGAHIMPWAEFSRTLDDAVSRYHVALASGNDNQGLWDLYFDSSRTLNALLTRHGAPDSDGCQGCSRKKYEYDPNFHVIDTPIGQGDPVKLVKPHTPPIPSPSKDVLTGAPAIQVTDSLSTPLFSEEQIASLFTVSTTSADDKAVELAKLAALEISIKRAEAANDRLSDAVPELALSKQIRDFVTASLKNRKTYVVNDWTQVVQAIPPIKTREEKLAQLREEIVADGTKYAPMLAGGGGQQLAHLADATKRIEFNDLIYMLLRRSHLPFHAQLGTNDVAHFNALMNKLASYLVDATYVQQVKRLTEAVRSKNSEEVVRIALGERNYSVDEHIEYLVFEYFTDLLIRKDQVEALNRLAIKDGRIENEGALIEMIPGSGKTSVLLPLLIALDGSRDWLNVIMLPEALVRSMSKELSTRLGKAFSSGVDVVEVSRKNYFGRDDLALLYKRLQDDRVSGRTVVVTNSSVQSLFLNFVSRVLQADKRPDEIALFANIFRFLREYGRLNIDEVDLALDVLHSHQFSVGESISLIDSEKLRPLPNVALSFYHLLATDPEICTLVSLPFIRCAVDSPLAEAFTKDVYETLKPTLVDKILDAKPFFFGEDRFQRLLEAIPKEAARTYLLHGDRAIFDDKLDTTSKNILATIFEELHSVFPLTAQKKLGVHYGPIEEELLPDGKPVKARFGDRLFAIPYHLGSPVNRSRFGTPLEALNYTLQMILESGNYTNILEDEVVFLNKLSQVNVARFTKRLRTLGMVGQRIHGIGPEELRRLANDTALPANLNRQFNLIKHQVLKQVRVYPQQLNTNAQLYATIFKHLNVNGLSGTLWNSSTYPKIFAGFDLSETTPETFWTLWRDYGPDGKPRHVRVVKPTIDSVYEGGGGAKSSLIDEGGFFVEKKNWDIAERVHEKTKRSIYYYDIGNDITWFPAGAEAPLEQRGAFWDKRHTTGSDLKVAPDTEAFFTFDEHLVSRNIQQSAWRLRGLNKNQKIIDYCVTKEGEAIINTRLGDWKIAHDMPISLGDVFVYSLVYQDVRLRELRIRAARQKIKNVAVAQIIDTLLADGTSSDAMIQAVTNSRSLFEIDIENKPLYQVFGFSSKLENTTTVLTNYAKAWWAGKPSLHAPMLAVISEEAAQLPAMIDSNTLDTDQEVEVEQEQEQEQELQTEQEEDFGEDPNYSPHDVVNWNLSANFTLATAPMELLHTALTNPKWGTSGAQTYLAEVLNEPLYVSKNFVPADAPGRSHFEFFGKYQKPVTDVLLFQTVDNAKFGLVILDANDTHQWEQFLRHSPPMTNVVVGLYNLGLGRVYRHSEGFEKVALPRFEEAIVEAKFFGGYVHYSNIEKGYLEAFVAGDKPADSEKRAHKLHDILVRDVLHFMRDSREGLNGSDLEEVFQAHGVR